MLKCNNELGFQDGAGKWMNMGSEKPGKKHVLYIGDGEEQTKLLKSLLEKEGLDVILSHDTSAVHEIVRAKTQSLSALIIDQDLASNAGFIIIQDLVLENICLPVIMLTGHEDVNSAVKAIKTGASDCLVKDRDLNYLKLLPSVIRSAILQSKLDFEKKENDERYKALVEFSPDCIMLHNRAKFLFLNNAGRALFEVAVSQEASVFEFIHPDDLDFVNGKFLAGLSGRESVLFIETKLLLKSGAQVDVEISGFPIIYKGEKVIQAIARDITERKRMERLLQYQALHDSLTGLPNRTLFFDRLAYAISLAKRQERSFAVMFLDLDMFKYVNDTFGHKAGDMALKIAAKRLKECLRDSDTIARMGGDEFAAVAFLQSEREALMVAKRIINSIGQPFKVEGTEARIGVSIGISLFGINGTEAEDLYQKADSAMYHAKQKGKNRVVLHSAGSQSVSRTEVVSSCSWQVGQEKKETPAETEWK